MLATRQYYLLRCQVRLNLTFFFFYMQETHIFLLAVTRVTKMKSQNRLTDCFVNRPRMPQTKVFHSNIPDSYALLLSSLHFNFMKKVESTSIENITRF